MPNFGEFVGDQTPIDVRGFMPSTDVLFFGLSLVLGIASRHLLRGTRVPYTVALLVLGILLEYLGSLLQTALLEEELRKQIGVVAYIECSSKTQQLFLTICTPVTLYFTDEVSLMANQPSRLSDSTQCFLLWLLVGMPMNF